MKIAVVGSGISGLACAYLLSAQHEVSLYEKNSVLGGHSRTINIQLAHKKIAVDTGFIVFNKRNYPYLTKLFEHLGVSIAKSKMSFGVNIDAGKLQYSTSNLRGIFAQKTNIFSVKYWGMLLDIIKFNRHALKCVEQYPHISLGELISKLNLGKWFADYYLLAMGGAIWSTPVNDMLSYPAATFINFFNNHGLLTLTKQPQWYTVVGGSCQYVQALASKINNIALNTSIEQIITAKNKVVMVDNHGKRREFDKVILACHSYQAAKLTPNTAAQNLLANITYQENQAILHSDTSYMPSNKDAWSSWSYSNDNQHNLSLNYWMNNLQPLNTQQDIIVSLNPTKLPKSELIYDQYTFAHPVFNSAAIAAQQNLASIQGVDNLYYCGAWVKYGFHEDGLASAINLVKLFNAVPKWLF